jgi:hypothetical protein
MDLPNLDFLSNFNKIIEKEKTEITQVQFEQFVSNYDIELTDTLKNSYFSFVSKLDALSGNNDLVAHPFIINLLNSSVKQKDKDLKKLVLSFCAFVLTAGTKNSKMHQWKRRNYSESLIQIVKEIESHEGKTWIMIFRERLDTKENN